jgi:hypothetical protein
MLLFIQYDQCSQQASICYGWHLGAQRMIKTIIQCTAEADYTYAIGEADSFLQPLLSY